MTRPARIGLVLFGVGDLTGGGGAERFFADLFAAYEHSASRRAHELWLICDASAVSRLREIGRLPESPRIVDLSAVGGNRLAMMQAMWQFASGTHFDLLHLTLALPRHLPWLWLSAWRRPRAAVTLNVNDYEVAARMHTAPAPLGLDLAWRTYRAYFRARALDGVMAWYRNLISAIECLSRRPPVLRAIRHCFVDTARFRPAGTKENLVVHAGRLVAVKRPMLYLDAIAEARRRNPAALAAWRFVLLGKGPLEAALRAHSSALGLDDLLQFDFAADTSHLFSRAKLFVSTQDHENFTPLSMLEAMACGNAILARDVGQTADFVREGTNGLLVREATPGALADGLLRMLGDEATLASYGAQSRRITLEEHCAENLLEEFDQFWRDVLAQRR